MRINLFKNAFGAALCFSLMACSDDSSDGSKISGTEENADEDIVAVENMDLAGISQKGPFVTGSVVTLQELNGITLNQTGKSFKGSIKSDKGDFVIAGIDLSSQYAVLEASGYYRDEITGKKSPGPITLRAITDLSNRKTVNINLLTHLEYDRVMFLVDKKKRSIAKAKAQAEKEIFDIFGIDGEIVESEDLNIFKPGDANAALLAVSVLMQSDVDVGGLTERIGNFSIALAEEGVWDDAETKAKIADWACDADLNGNLLDIRKNVEGWKYSDSIPPFEKYVTKFWWDNYGLGACNKKNDGEVQKNINKLSELYEGRFTCENGHWIVLNDDKDDDDDDVVESSSSKVNPFVSSSSVSSSSVQYAESVPVIPGELSFLDEFVDSYNGYMEFGEGQQKDWFAGKNMFAQNRDSVLAMLADTLNVYGFEYAGKVFNDSLNEKYTYDDSSVVYQKESKGQTYKVYITPYYYTYIFGFSYASDLRYDLKIAVIKDGFEEQETVDRYSLRFESDFSEELSFMNEYFIVENKNSENVIVSYKTLVSYNDDSLTTHWQLAKGVGETWAGKDVNKYEDWNETNKQLEIFEQALVKEGFEKTGEEPNESDTWAKANLPVDEDIIWKTYEKETDKAKYKVVCYASVAGAGGTIASFQLAYFADVYTQYKVR
ncbi:MAG: hypothetical protein MJY99_09365 [Fibrobacter sp.]|nr:hypothetical protein [Fibrobacter sp.]